VGRMKAIPKPVIHTSANAAIVADTTFLAAVKSFLKIDNTDDDTLIKALIQVATERLEKECNLKFITQKWDIYYDAFSYKKAKDDWWDGTREGALAQFTSNIETLELPFGPCSAISAFKTFADDGSDTSSTFASTNYQLDTNSATPRVGLRSGCSWPSTLLRPFNGIKLEECTFGFASTFAAIPDALAHAVKLTVAKLYENRGDVTDKEFSIPNTALMLIGPYSRARI
jgi:hypothetical protein